VRLQLQLDLGLGAEEEGGDFYNPDGIKEGEGEGGSLERREGRVRVAEDKLSASGVIAQGERDWAYLHSPSSSPACAGDLVEIIADSTFYSIPKAPKEGVNPKGNLLPPCPRSPPLSPSYSASRSCVLPPSQEPSLLASQPSSPARFRLARDRDHVEVHGQEWRHLFGEQARSCEGGQRGEGGKALRGREAPRVVVGGGARGMEGEWRGVGGKEGEEGQGRVLEYLPSPPYPLLRPPSPPTERSLLTLTSSWATLSFGR